MKNTFLGSRESETRAYLALSTRWMTWWSQKTEQLLGLKPCNGYFTAFSSALVRKGKLKFGFEVVFTPARTNSWNRFFTYALDLNVCKAERVKSFLWSDRTARSKLSRSQWARKKWIFFSFKRVFRWSKQSSSCRINGTFDSRFKKGTKKGTFGPINIIFEFFY